MSRLPRSPSLSQGGSRALNPLAVLVALVLGLTTSATTAHAGTPHGASTQSEVAAQASTVAPRFITGYSYHCSEEMAADNISGPEAEWVVGNYYFSADYDEEQDTWRYDGPGITVVLNPSGYCVTAWRR